MTFFSLKAGVIAIGICFLPGRALLSSLRRKVRLDPIERFALATGLSLAVIPYSLHVMTSIGLRQTRVALWVLLGLCSLIILWDLSRPDPEDTVEGFGTEGTTVGVFVAIFAATLISRLVSISGLQFPLWTDSYHHTLITQIIADTGKVPSSYEPYASIPQFTYHFGFHSLVAWFHMLTSIPVPRSVLIMGQIVNALVVPTTFMLAKQLWDSNRRALLASLLLGLLSHMPAFFVNWGRYPQLTGQILMPAALSLYLLLLRSEVRSCALIALSALAAAGLFLVHIRVTVFLIVFGGLFFLRTLQREQGIKRRWRYHLVNTGLVSLSAILLDSSWLVEFADGFGGRVAESLIGGFDPSIHGSYFEWNWLYLPEFGAPLSILVLAAVAVLMGVKQRDEGILILLLGSSILFALSFTNTIGVTPLFSALIVAIWIYLPAGLMGGYTLDTFYSEISVLLKNRGISNKLISPLFVIVLMIAVAHGFGRVKGIVQPKYRFVTDEDLLAMSWIRRNTDPEAIFHISTRFWTPTVVHGLDAGYWIPYLTDRQTTIPPQTYASDGDSKLIEFINTRARDLSPDLSVEELYDSMLAYDVTHLYIGGRRTHLTAHTFSELSEMFDVQYHRGDVWIIAICPPPQRPLTSTRPSVGHTDQTARSRLAGRPGGP